MIEGSTKIVTMPLESFNLSQTFQHMSCMTQHLQRLACSLANSSLVKHCGTQNSYDHHYKKDSLEANPIRLSVGNCY